MYINAIAHYIPSERVPNSYFEPLNGLSESWILQRTGIKSRSKASEQENCNTMAISATQELEGKLSFDIKEIDLIVGASYSPHDTVFTLAHAVQRAFNIADTQTVYVSSACSSLVNSMEIVEGYFATGKASKALIVCSEHNWSYSNSSDPKAGHLWGDGAVAICLTKDDLTGVSPRIIDIYTRGLGHIGHANDSVNLRPKTDGVRMDNGRDVFIYACQYMPQALQRVLDRNNLKPEQLNYLSGHQANMRIINNVVQALQLPPNTQLLTNIEELGNTGSPSNLIVISQNQHRFQRGDLIGSTVFGGGYSCGAYIIEW